MSGITVDLIPIKTCNFCIINGKVLCKWSVLVSVLSTFAHMFLQVAASGVASKMVLTDGNALSVSNVKVSLQKNKLSVETFAR